jgi:hypothetical protein
MPRISRELATQKESFVSGLFATNPALTIREVQEALKGQFNQTMNPATILKLKGNITKRDSPIVVAEQVETTVQTEVATEVQAAPTAVEETTTTVSVTPETVVAAEVVKVDPVLVPMVEVTNANGTHLESPQPAPEGTIEKTIRAGLVEVVKEG